MTSAAVDETSYKRVHNYLTLLADAKQRKLVFVTEGRDAATIEQFRRPSASAQRHARANHLGQHRHVACLHQGCQRAPAQRPYHLRQIPRCRSGIVCSGQDAAARAEDRPGLKGLRWALLTDRDRLSVAQRADLDALVANVTTKRTARAWLYREQLRDILDRNQINVVSEMLEQWCINVMRSKVEPMKEVARMIRKHFDGIVAWTQTRQTNGFLEALNGLFQAAKRRARGYANLTTMRTVLFLIAGKLDFTSINPHAA